MGHMKVRSLVPLFCFCSSVIFSEQWTGMTSGDWGTTTNWTPNTVPNAVNAVANFNLSPDPTNRTITLGATRTAGTITFDSTGGYTINAGSTLNLHASSRSATVSVTKANGNGANTINSPIALLSPLTINHSGTGDLTFTGVISNNPASTARKITKTGNGRAIFSGGGGNTYSGGTEISAGTLAIDNDNKLGPASMAVTIGSGVLQYTASDSNSRPFSLAGSAGIQADGGAVVATLMGTISGTGSLAIAGSGEVVLTNTANSYQGGNSVNGGTLTISSNDQLGSSSGHLSFGGGTLKLTSSPMAIPRSGTVTGASTIDSAGTITFQGNFSGAGSLRFINGGTFVLTGSNGYTGGNTVEANTHLSGTTSGVQGAITLSAASSIVTFSQNFDGTYSGAFKGPGQLHKVGSSTITFTGTSTDFTGPTTIQQGPLVVNGSLGNSSLVTVNSAGTLGGNGTVGPVTSNGTISPGTNVGTLHINGPLVMNAGSNVVIDLSPTDGDLIAVSGTATFGAAIPLMIAPEKGFYGFTIDRTILTSTGLVGAPIPGFGPLSSSISFFIPSITYTAMDVLLHVDVLQPFGFFQFSNQNTQAVGKNIDSLFAAGELSGDLFNVVNLFVGQSEAIINESLDQMHPAQLSALIDNQAEVIGQLMHIFHRFPYLPCACSNPNRFWVQPFGSSLTVKPHGIQIGYQGNSGGLALGYDGEIAPNWIFGFGTAWNTKHLDWHDSRGKGESNGFYGVAYTDYQWGAFYFGAALLSGIDFYDAHRDIEFISHNSTHNFNYISLHRKTDASFRSIDVVGQINSAYLFGAPQAYFYPYFNLDYLYFATETFQEEGAGSLNLKVSSRGDGILRTETGLALQVQDFNATETMCISPKISLGYVNITSLQRPMYESYFQDDPLSFKTRGWEKTWNLLHVDFGLSIAYKCFSLGLQYNVELSPNSHPFLQSTRKSTLRLEMVV